MVKIRHYQRYAVSGNGFICHTATQNISLFISNISASGISIIAKADFNKDEIITFEVQISGNLLTYSRQFKGKIVRKNTCDSNHQYGIRFLELHNNDMIELDEYLRLNYSNTTLYQPSFDSGNDNDPIRLLSRKIDS